MVDEEAELRAAFASISHYEEVSGDGGDGDGKGDGKGDAGPPRSSLYHKEKAEETAAIEERLAQLAETKQRFLDSLSVGAAESWSNFPPRYAECSFFFFVSSFTLVCIARNETPAS